MKALILATALLLNVNVFAAPAPAPNFEQLSKQTVVSLYGRKGDTVSAQLIQSKISSSEISETWSVLLTARTNGASYEVEVKQSLTEVSPGVPLATIAIKFVDSN